MTHNIHSEEHTHVHGQGCGHPAVQHEGHADYLHDGHLHSPHEGHYDEHTIAVNDQNPATCAPTPTSCGCGHNNQCGHQAVPHGDHTDYLATDGHLHHRHGDHCDDHGALATA